MICDACCGTGRHIHFRKQTCGVCKGTGEIIDDSRRIEALREELLRALDREEKLILAGMGL